MRSNLFLLLLLSLLSLSCHHVSSSSSSSTKSTYIIHMAKSKMPLEFTHHTHWYDSSLRSISPTANIIYTYDTITHGFAVRLTKSEAQLIQKMDGVTSVNPEIKYELHTTRTPEFLGIDKSTSFNPQSSTAADVVIGVLDTGVWPNKRSFSDSGLGPVPASWKGTCMTGRGFKSTTCNRKLIGAQYFSNGYESSMGPIDESKESKSPLDSDGHGTHTSSTAGGGFVPDASLLGYANGTARGMAPGSRVAIYKVCWTGGCFSSDILMGMEAAVTDGVNVLSLSLGGGTSDYYRDSVAIGAFTAMEKGILVSCSAGNAGPGAATMSNVAPWITTVGAGTLDRDFPADVELGNGKKFSGVSLYSGSTSLPASQLELVYAGNASNTTNGNLCMSGSLIPEKVAGKIVFCDRGVSARVQKGQVVKEAGGAGMVLANTAANGEELVADAHLLPATGVGESAGKEIKSYILTETKPTATIRFGGTKVNIQPSPVVAAFSSRGPNAVTPEILKPDIIAPGVNILAGWTGAVGPTGLAVDDRRVEFNIISGTSMSCPHVSGLAALLKAVHPEWSPAGIKSALMTTAYATYPNGDRLIDVSTNGAATPFDYGAGHVDPPKALDPGLIYDLTATDYLEFLCALNYTSLQIMALAKGNKFTCDGKKNYAVSDLNYPSFAVPFATTSGLGGEGSAVTVTHTRTLTNVGTAGTYKAKVTSETQDGEVKIAVDPMELSFKEQGEKKSYKISFTSESMPSGSSGFGRLEWSDGTHVVASPIAFTWT